MKRNILSCFFYCVVVVYTFGCQQNIKEENPKRVNFTINPLDRKIVLPVQLNNNTSADLAFDTGAYLGTLILDSAFCANNSDITANLIFDKKIQGGSSWSNMSVPINIYKTSPNIRIRNVDLSYTYMQVYNWKGYYNTNEAEGMFNIPQNDTTHVWELNFENNYLEVHPTVDFKMPEDCFIAPMEESRHYPFNVRLPLKIHFSDGDMLSLENIYMIDTGMPWDIALMYNSPELEFFNQKNDAVWTEYGRSYHRYHNVTAEIFDGYSVDSLRIYTFDYPMSIVCDYLIGLNFLKRFNVFFDLKNRQIGFQPIDNYQRVVNPTLKRFHFSSHLDKNGKLIVNKVADYEGNTYFNAGLRAKDEIIAVNGTNLKKMTVEMKERIFRHDTLIFDIVRDSKPLKIVVPLNMNEVQGD